MVVNLDGCRLSITLAGIVFLCDSWNSLSHGQNFHVTEVVIGVKYYSDIN